MSIEVAMQRVERGAKFLDKKRPDWHHELDMGSVSFRRDTGFTIGSMTRCVLGQLYGRFDVGMDRTKLALKITRYGFVWDSKAEIEELDAAWREQVAIRKAHDWVPKRRWFRRERTRELVSA